MGSRFIEALYKEASTADLKDKYEKAQLQIREKDTIISLLTERTQNTKKVIEKAEKTEEALKKERETRKQKEKDIKKFEREKEKLQRQKEDMAKQLKEHEERIQHLEDDVDAFKEETAQQQQQIRQELQTQREQSEVMKAFIGEMYKVVSQIAEEEEEDCDDDDDDDCDAKNTTQQRRESSARKQSMLQRLEALLSSPPSAPSAAAIAPSPINNHRHPVTGLIPATKRKAPPAAALLTTAASKPATTTRATRTRAVVTTHEPTLHEDEGEGVGEATTTKGRKRQRQRQQPQSPTTQQPAAAGTAEQNKEVTSPQKKARTATTTRKQQQQQQQQPKGVGQPGTRKVKPTNSATAEPALHPLQQQQQQQRRQAQKAGGSGGGVTAAAVSAPSQADFATMASAPAAALPSIAGVLSRFGVSTAMDGGGLVLAATTEAALLAEELVEEQLQRLLTRPLPDNNNTDDASELEHGEQKQQEEEEDVNELVKDAALQLAEAVVNGDILRVRLLNAFIDGVMRCAAATLMVPSNNTTTTGTGSIINAIDGGSGFINRWHRKEYRTDSIDTLVQCAIHIDTVLSSHTFDPGNRGTTSTTTISVWEGLCDSLRERLHRRALLAVMQNETPRFTETEVCAAAAAVAVLCKAKNNKEAFEAFVLDLLLANPTKPTSALTALTAALEVWPESLPPPTATIAFDLDALQQLHNQNKLGKIDIMHSLLHELSVYSISPRSSRLQHHTTTVGNELGLGLLVSNVNPLLEGVGVVVGGIHGMYDRVVPAWHPELAAQYLLALGRSRWNWLPTSATAEGQHGGGGSGGAGVDALKDVVDFCITILTRHCTL